jgi:hypothetical protein
MNFLDDSYDQASLKNSFPKKEIKLLCDRKNEKAAKVWEGI